MGSSGTVTLTYKCKTEDKAYNLDNMRLLLVVIIYLQVVQGLEGRQATSSVVYDYFLSFSVWCGTQTF